MRRIGDELLELVLRPVDQHRDLSGGEWMSHGACPVADSTVKLYRIDAGGAKTLLGSALTDAHGCYSIANPAAANASVLVEASGGTYVDEVSGQSMSLSAPMRAAATWTGSAVTAA